MAALYSSPKSQVFCGGTLSKDCLIDHRIINHSNALKNINKNWSFQFQQIVF